MPCGLGAWLYVGVLAIFCSAALSADQTSSLHRVNVLDRIYFICCYHLRPSHCSATLALVKILIVSNCRVFLFHFPPFQSHCTVLCTLGAGWLHRTHHSVLNPLNFFSSLSFPISKLGTWELISGNTLYMVLVWGCTWMQASKHSHLNLCVKSDMLVYKLIWLFSWLESSRHVYSLFCSTLVYLRHCGSGYQQFVLSSTFLAICFLLLCTEFLSLPLKNFCLTMNGKSPCPGVRKHYDRMGFRHKLYFL